nr:MAG TPA: hypothetical protein [Caudoviricetes sp.]
MPDVYLPYVSDRNALRFLYIILFHPNVCTHSLRVFPLTLKTSMAYGEVAHRCCLIY